MRDVDNQPDAVHLGDGSAAQIAEPGIGLLGAAVAEQIAPVVSDVQHAHAELEQSSNIAELIFHRHPTLRQRYTVPGEVETAVALGFSGSNIVRASRLHDKVAHHVTEIGETSHAANQAKGILTLLAGAFHNAGYSRSLPRIHILRLLGGIGYAAEHPHLLEKHVQLARRRSGIDRFRHFGRVDGCSWREAIAIDYDGVGMQSHPALQLAARWFENVQRRLARAFHHEVRLGNLKRTLE